jgi:hypothetical protein
MHAHRLEQQFRLAVRSSRRGALRCRENGDESCKVVVTVRGLCGAVAISGNCEARGWAYAGSRGEAEQLALNECSSRGGRGCTIHRWVCDGR